MEIGLLVLALSLVVSSLVFAATLAACVFGFAWQANQLLKQLRAFDAQFMQQLWGQYVEAARSIAQAAMHDNEDEDEDDVPG